MTSEKKTNYIPPGIDDPKGGLPTTSKSILSIADLEPYAEQYDKSGPVTKPHWLSTPSAVNGYSRYNLSLIYNRADEAQQYLILDILKKSGMSERDIAYLTQASSEIPLEYQIHVFATRRSLLLRHFRSIYIQHVMGSSPLAYYAKHGDVKLKNLLQGIESRKKRQVDAKYQREFFVSMFDLLTLKQMAALALLAGVPTAIVVLFASKAEPDLFTMIENIKSSTPESDGLTIYLLLGLLIISYLSTAFAAHSLAAPKLPEAREKRDQRKKQWNESKKEIINNEKRKIEIGYSSAREIVDKMHQAMNSYSKSDDDSHLLIS